MPGGSAGRSDDEAVAEQERIARVEAGVRPSAPLRSEPAAPVPVPELLARYAVPGASVAVLEDGRLAWARGYGVLAAGRGRPGHPGDGLPGLLHQQARGRRGRPAAGGRGPAGPGRGRQRDPPRLAPAPERRLGAAGHPAPPAQPHRRTDGELVPGVPPRGAGADPAAGPARRAPANTPPVRAVLVPGTRFRYSGSHYSVLQQLLVDATGAPFPDLTRELVFAPLGMADSSYDQAYPESRPESAAVGHQIGGEPVPGGWRVLPEMAGAGLWTTPADLARLLLDVQRAHAGGAGRVLPPAVAREALTAQPGGWGLGFALEGTGATRRFGHGGDNIGYKCRMTAYVGAGRGAVVTTNGDDGYLVHEALLRAVAAEYGWPEFPGGDEAVQGSRPPDDGAAGRRRRDVPDGGGGAAGRGRGARRGAVADGRGAGAAGVRRAAGGRVRRAPPERRPRPRARPGRPGRRAHPDAGGGGALRRANLRGLSR